MAGKVEKGTNDGDGNGEKGGSKPLTDLDRLERRGEALEEAAKANGWSSHAD